MKYYRQLDVPQHRNKQVDLDSESGERLVEIDEAATLLDNHLDSAVIPDCRWER